MNKKKGLQEDSKMIKLFLSLSLRKMEHAVMKIDIVWGQSEGKTFQLV